MLDPRTPVLIGCGQVKQRTDDPDLLRIMQHEEIGGRAGRVRPGGVLELV